MKIFLNILVVLVCALILGTLTMWLWNFVMPPIFGLPELSWIQAWALYCLTYILFGKTVNIKTDNN